MFLIDRTSVEALQQEWSAFIPLDIVAKSVLGVTKAVVLSLEQAGMLTPRRGPHQDGYKVRLYSQADVMQFEKLMLPHVRRVSEPPTNALPLPKACNGMGKPLAEILRAALDNHLTLLEARGNQPLFQRLALPPSQLHRLLQEQ